MNISPHVSLILSAQVTPQEETARGQFTLGTALQNIAIPEEANQMLAVTFTLAAPGSEVDAPSAFYLEPATGQAEIDANHVPAGWTSDEFNTWAVLEKFGATLPARDVDGIALDLNTIYAIAINATAPVEISSASNSGVPWSNFLTTDSVLNVRDFLSTTPDGLPLVADEQLRIQNNSGEPNTITVVMLGKQ